MDEAAFPILLVDCCAGTAPVVWAISKRWWTLVQPRGRIHRPQWPGNAAGPLGGRRGLFAVYAGGGNLGAAGRGRSGGRGGRERHCRVHLRETADNWNDNIERWTYAAEHRPGAADRSGRATTCELRRRDWTARLPAQGFVPIKNRPPGQSEEPAVHLISPDASRAGAIWVAGGG